MWARQSFEYLNKAVSVVELTAVAMFQAVRNLMSWNKVFLIYFPKCVSSFKDSLSILRCRSIVHALRSAFNLVEKLGRLHFFHGIILARKVCSSDRRCYYANNKKRFASAQWKTDYLLKQTLLWMKHNWFLDGRLSASLEDSSSSTHTSSSSPTKQPHPTPNSTQMTTITPTQPQPLMPPPTHLKTPLQPPPAPRPSPSLLPLHLPNNHSPKTNNQTTQNLPKSPLQKRNSLTRALGTLDNTNITVKYRKKNVPTFILPTKQLIPPFRNHLQPLQNLHLPQRGHLPRTKLSLDTTLAPPPNLHQKMPTPPHEPQHPVALAFT